MHVSGKEKNIVAESLPCVAFSETFLVQRFYLYAVGGSIVVSAPGVVSLRLHQPKHGRQD